MANAVPDAVLWADHRGSVREGNARADELFCYPKFGSELKLESLIDLDGPLSDGDSPEIRRDACSYALLQGRMQTTATACNGEQCEVSVWFRPWRSGLVCIVRDLTIQGIAEREVRRHASQLAMTKHALERHNAMLESLVEQRTDALQRARQDADKANRAKSDFLACISHELRTPLHGILSFCTFGLKRLELATTDEPLHRYLTRIEHCGHTLLTLVNDLLDLAKAESGAMQLHRTELSIAELVARLFDEFQGVFVQKGVLAKFDADSATLPIQGDEEKLLRVLRNLLSNAVKVSPVGGRVDVVIVERNGEIVVSVIDEGPGIPPGEVKSIFGRFVQAGTTSAGGTGLGLAICREIVAAHGGQIWAENRAEGGARVSFSLPCPAAPTSQCLERPDVSHDDCAGCDAEALSPGDRFAALASPAANNSTDLVEVPESFMEAYLAKAVTTAGESQ